MFRQLRFLLDGRAFASNDTGKLKPVGFTKASWKTRGSTAFRLAAMKAMLPQSNTL
jgi:hypothetical protein